MENLQVFQILRFSTKQNGIYQNKTFFAYDLSLMFGWNNFDLEHPQRIVPHEEQNVLMEEFAKALPEKTRIVGVISNPMIDQYHACGRNPAYDGIRAKYGSINAAL